MRTDGEGREKRAHTGQGVAAALRTAAAPRTRPSPLQGPGLPAPDPVRQAL